MEWRNKNRKRLNKYLLNYLKKTGKKYYTKEKSRFLVSIHHWVEKRLGTPMKCSICGTEKKRVYHWSNKDHQYKKNLNDWQRLCPTCHREYDRKFNDIKTYLEK
jgi:hypothetical protein